VLKIRYCQAYPWLETPGIIVYLKPDCCWPTLIGTLSECYFLSELRMTMAFTLESGSLLKREGDSASVWILLLLAMCRLMVSCRLFRHQLEAVQFAFLKHSRVSFSLMVFRSGLFSLSFCLFLLSLHILHILSHSSYSSC
jgi:hypothetical protein